jgi:hypothetical protein
VRNIAGEGEEGGKGGFEIANCKMKIANLRMLRDFIYVRRG